MGDIYCGSICHIVALQSATATGGCFTVRHPLVQRACLVGGTSKRVLGFDQIGRSDATPSGKLLRRGWVLQERVLAPRTVFFGDDRIWWECVECNAQEHDTHLSPSARRLAVNLKAAFDRMTFQGVLDLTYLSRQYLAFYKMWTGLVA